jgi:hypothetical protein
MGSGRLNKQVLLWYMGCVCFLVQKPHVIKGKEIDCKKALRKSQLPPTKKRQIGGPGGGGNWNGRGGYNGGGFDGKDTGMFHVDVPKKLSVVMEPAE